MTGSAIEETTSRFYHWESRCRGWDVYNAPVALEPPFQPFYKVMLQPTEFVDDGRVPTLTEKFIKALPFFKKEQKEETMEVLIPFAYKREGYLEAFTVTLPKNVTTGIEDSAQLLLMLSTSGNPISFEIIATHSAITLQFVCHEQDIRHVKSQVKIFFPDCILTDTTSQLNHLLKEDLAACVIDHGLSEEFMRPIQTPEEFSSEALTGIFGALDHLQGNERAIIQILFKSADAPWAQSIIQSVTAQDGRSFFLDAPDMPKLAHAKISAPLFGVVVRAIGQADSLEQAFDVTRNLSQLITQTTKSATNCLVPLSSDTYPIQEHLDDVVYRQSCRVGMILNSKELTTLVHIPSSNVSATKLNRDVQKTKVAPTSAEGATLVLGVNIHQGTQRSVAINAAQRMRHTHIIGATGTGKSTLLQNLMDQDIDAGRGFAVLDPHGDLIENLLDRIPLNRVKDVVVIDPSNTEFPVAFNILQAHSEIEKDVLSSDLVAIFRRLSTSWGDAMNSVFANGILAFLESKQGGTLMDLRRFFVEKSFREEFLLSVSDPSIQYYWRKEYPLLKSNSIGPILTRMDSFLRPKIIRNMVAQKKSLDFAALMDQQKILLVKLPQGLIGTENSYLLGSVIVSKLYQMAMARQATDAAQRKDFFLYIDEFQNFITPSMSHILSGARKYRLGLVLAHQDMRQLVKEDMELSDSIMSNAGTRICFRLGDTDAKRFENGFSFFDEQDLQNLGTGQAICRIEKPENDFNLSVIQPQTSNNFNLHHEILNHSNTSFGTPRLEIEKLSDYLHVESLTTKTTEDRNTELPIQDKKESIVLKQTTPIQQKFQILNTDDAKATAVVDSLTEEEQSKAKAHFVQQKEVSRHRYLQNLIKKMAEARGYRAQIEQTTPEGQGRVDVLLERKGKRIACEIGVTTNKKWEVHNIEKCLRAGYETIIALAADTKAKRGMEIKIQETIEKALQAKVYVMEADELFQYLDVEVTKDATIHTTVKGYRVKVEYDAVSNEDMKKKQDSIARLVIDAKHNKNK